MPDADHKDEETLLPDLADYPAIAGADAEEILFPFKLLYPG
jgi:hypothetical protein